MESNHDPTALALQVQALEASVKELTRPNQEMRLRIQQEENRSKINQEGNEDSQRRSDRRRPLWMNQTQIFFLEMRKEMDELRNAIKGETDRSLDRMVRTTDLPL